MTVNSMTKQMTYTEAIHDALSLALQKDPRVFIIGEGVPDPKGVFGSTIGLQKEFGSDRVMDMPVSENGMTGICIGASLMGMRPVLTHQRIDFSLYSFDQIVNTAAKWFSMFGGQQSVPLVIRMVIGRGWGQGAQHSQSLQALFAHIPGLKVVMPVTPSDAKGLLLASIEDPNPVIYIEHRWLHNLSGDVASGYWTTPIGKARIARRGKDMTIIATSHMVVESMRSAEIAMTYGIDVDVIDIRSLAPYDMETIMSSVKKTKRVIVCDTAVERCGFSAEMLAAIAESGIDLLSPPARIALPNIPTPTSWKLSEKYYPTYRDILVRMFSIMGRKKQEIDNIMTALNDDDVRSDVPDASFQGPF